MRLQKTNNTEIGLYFREENPDGTREYSTIVYEFPYRDFYAGLSFEDYDGEPFRNSTDIVK